jgi:hypothetical protein
VKLEAENIMEAEIGGPISAVQVFAVRWNLLGVLEFVEAVGKLRKQRRKSS